MNTGKLGLVFNLVGSIFLGLHIFGFRRLMCWEGRIKKLPTVIPAVISSLILKIVGFTVKKSVTTRPRQTMKELLELKHKSEKEGAVNLLSDIPNLRTKPFFYGIIKGFIWGGLISIPFWILLSPIILLLFIITKPFALVQEKARIETYFGLLGILFLIIGFILQMYSK